jgi:hypothetical protein
MNGKEDAEVTQTDRQSNSETQCNTKRNIVVPFRVSWKEYKQLIQKAGGKGKVGQYIREKLGIEENHSGKGREAQIQQTHAQSLERTQLPGTCAQLHTNQRQDQPEPRTRSSLHLSVSPGSAATSNETPLSRRLGAVALSKLLEKGPD